MRRRRLVVTAGALSATAFAATVAIGANFGLVSHAASDSPVGHLDDHRATATAGSPPAAAVGVPALGSNADD
jgi:hypothetical protein